MLSIFCPPCPSKIVSKLAFSPPECTYSFVEVEGEDDGNDNRAEPSASNDIRQGDTKAHDNNKKYKLKLDERAEWQFSDSELKNIEVFYANHGRNDRIACMYVKCTSNPKFTIIFSHGNAADLGLMSSFFLGLGKKIGCNLCGYDYSGYGASSGRPTEKSLYTNIKTAWNELQSRHNVTADKVILYGQSIGTVPTVDLASKYDFAGVILHSPLTSGLRLAFPNTKRTWFFDAFPNIDKVPKIKSPVLVIHGTEDEVIDITHGQAIHALCPNPVSPLWVQGAGHNDIELFREYLERVKKFVNKDIVKENS